MNIIKYKSWFFGLSLLVLAWGGFGLIRFGLRPAIDFTGGSLLEVQLPDFSSDIKIDDLQPLAKDIYEITAVQNSGAQTWILRGKPLANDSKNQVLINLKSQFGQVIELRFETVGPTLGTETLKKMLLAIIIVSSVITLYVWHQFHELKYGFFCSRYYCGLRSDSGVEALSSQATICQYCQCRYLADFGSIT